MSIAVLVVPGLLLQSPTKDKPRDSKEHKGHQVEITGTLIDPDGVMGQGKTWRFDETDREICPATRPSSGRH
jgi:hypothetical protein